MQSIGHAPAIPGQKERTAHPLRAGNGHVGPGQVHHSTLQFRTSLQQLSQRPRCPEGALRDEGQRLLCGLRAALDGPACQFIPQLSHQPMVEVGDGDPEMAHDVVALPAQGRGLVVNGVAVDRREVLHPMAQVAGDGEGLEENLEANHGRAKVEENTALQIGHRRTVDFEILAAGPSQSGEVALRVLVDDVGAQGDVDSHRHAQSVALVEDADLLMVETLIFSDEASQGLAVPQPIARPPPDGAVHKGTRLLDYAEGAILAGLTDEGQLEVVDGDRAVTCHVGDDPSS